MPDGIIAKPHPLKVTPPGTFSEEHCLSCQSLLTVEKDSWWGMQTPIEACQVWLENQPHVQRQNIAAH